MTKQRAGISATTQQALSVPARRTKDIPAAQLVACIDCAADRGEPCRSAAGKVVAPHVSRRRRAARIFFGPAQP